MKITEIESIKPYLVFSRIIGIGTTAICFLMRDGNVVKYYLNTSNTRVLFYGKHAKIIDFFTELSELENTTYRTPRELLVQEDKVIAYIYPYVKAKTLHDISGNTKIFDIKNSYARLLADTKEISDKNLTLGDLHSKNILYNDNFYVIDMDQGIFENIKNLNQFKINMLYLAKTFLYELFKVKDDEIFNFVNNNLNEVYHHVDWTNMDSVNNFFEELARSIDNSNPSIKDIRRKTMVFKQKNTYYKPF